MRSPIELLRSIPNGRRNMRQLVHPLSLCLLVLMFAASLLLLPKKVEAIAGNPSRGVVISQVYGGAGCGTAGCSTYQNDFIELYNHSTTAISLNGWSVQYASATGTSWQVTALTNVTLQPGQYYLVAESSSANGVNPLPTPDVTGTIAMSATAAKVALVNSTTAITSGTSCPSTFLTGTPAVIDFVGYGATANCFEGTGPAPAPSTTTADIRAGGGNTDTDNNSTDFTAATPTPRNTASATNTPTAADGSITGRVVTEDGMGVGGAVVTLSGTEFRKTITDSSGRYHFDNVEAAGFYTLTPELANYTFSPHSRSFSQIGNQTDAVFKASADAIQTQNPLETPEYFVRQQYLDFLGREPDAGGLAYWSGKINACGSDSACVREERINVSAAFFMSDEFQQTGSFIYRLYKAGLGRELSYQEFSQDHARVVDNGALSVNRSAFAASFVTRPEFVQKYSSANTAESFVDALLRTMSQSSGVDLSSQRDALIASYKSGGSLDESRSLALRSAIEAESFRQSQVNSSFVLTEYFGYLHRDADSGGYQFWLDVLNNRVPGNYRSMVCAFLTSSEYQRQFSTIVTHSNAECAQ